MKLWSEKKPKSFCAYFSKELTSSIPETLVGSADHWTHQSVVTFYMFYFSICPVIIVLIFGCIRYILYDYKIIYKQSQFISKMEGALKRSLVLIIYGYTVTEISFINNDKQIINNINKLNTKVVWFLSLNVIGITFTSFEMMLKEKR